MVWSTNGYALMIVGGRYLQNIDIQVADTETFNVSVFKGSVMLVVISRDVLSLSRIHKRSLMESCLSMIESIIYKSMYCLLWFYNNEVCLPMRMADSPKRQSTGSVRNLKRKINGKLFYTTENIINDYGYRL